METLFIESNRETAVSLTETTAEVVPTSITTEPSEIVNRASWSTTIDPLLLEPGDQISLESASINIKGAESSEFQTFLGDVKNSSGTSLNKKDNQTELEVCYYVSNNLQSNCPLPLGTATRTDSRGAFFSRTDWGGPSLSGKQIWGVNWKEYSSVLPATDGPKDRDNKHFCNMNSYNLDWKMGRNNFFYTTLGQDIGAEYETAESTQTNVALNQTGYGAGQHTAEKQRTCEAAGYLAFTNNYALWGNQGVQFSQSLPNMQDTINKNISNKDKGIFVRDLPASPAVFSTDADTGETTLAQAEQPYIQGGSSGYQIIPGGIWNNQALPFSRGRGDIEIVPGGIGANPYYTKNAVAQCLHGMYQYNLAKTAYNTLPIDYQDMVSTLKDDFQTGDWVYNDPMVIESLRFKGGRNTTAPNNMKLFCSDYINEETQNLGPYYNAIVNPLIPIKDSGSWEQAKLYFREFPHYNRDTRYFHYLKQKIKLEVPEGNISSTRVAQILTDQMKEREGNVDNLSNSIGISPAVYSVFQSIPENDYITATDATTDIGVCKKILPALSSKLFGTYPTSNGFIWETLYQTQQNPSLSGWNNTEPEFCYWNEDNNHDDEYSPNPCQMGNNYSLNQGLDKFYKIMLVGNPNEWKSICWLNPMIQSTPCTSEQVANMTHRNNFYFYSIYTGLKPHYGAGGGNYKNNFIAVRKNNDGTMNTEDYMIGQYGCNSCILEGGYDNMSDKTGEKNIILTNETRAFMCDWYLGCQRYGHIQGGRHYYDTYGRNQRSMIYSEAKLRLKYKPQRMSFLTTNIIFNGNISLSILNENFELLKKILNNSSTENNIVSNSSIFNDSHYVDWVIGRIDDAYTSPNAPSYNIQSYDDYEVKRINPASGLCPPVPARYGTARFLPNIYQTYKQYKQVPFIISQLQVGANPLHSEPFYSIYSFKEQDIEIDGVTYTIGGNYASVNENIGTEKADMTASATGFNGNIQPQNNFYARDTDYHLFNFDDTLDDDDKKEKAGKMAYGIPSWSTLAEDFTTTINTSDGDESMYSKTPNTNQNPSYAYQKALRRSIKGFRYLPQLDNAGNKITYWNGEDAWNETIPLPNYISQKFSTRPSGTLWNKSQLIFLWLKLTSLNDGKGIGCIPLFYKKSILDTLKNEGDTDDVDIKMADVPFLTIIIQEQSEKDSFLMPETGEYISLGTTPSLSQNILSYPTTTQQTELQNTKQLANVNLIQNGNDNVRNNYYQSNVGLNDSYDSISVNYDPASPLNSNKNVVRDIIGFNPSQSENMLQYLASGGKTYSSVISIGANDPAMTYDNNADRFYLQNLHTQLAQGNGVFQLGSAGANPSPEAEIETAYTKTSAFSQQTNLPCGYYHKNNDRRPFYPTAGGNGNTAPIQICGGYYPITASDYEDPISTAPGQTNPAADYYVGPSWCSCVRSKEDQNYNKPIGDYTMDYGSDPASYALTQLTNQRDDFWLPGDTHGNQNEGASAGDKRIKRRILMAQSIDGNVIKATFPYLNLVGRKYYDINGIEITSGSLNRSIEPGGYTLSKTPLRNKINLPCMYGSTLTKLVPNSTYMSPYDCNQFKLRTLDCPQILTGAYEDPFILDDYNSSYVNQFQYLLDPTLIPYAYIRTDTNAVCNTAQSGIGIIGLSILKSNEESIALNSISYKLFKGTLLNRLGFNLNQILPIFSLPQNLLIPVKYNKYLSPSSNAYLIQSNQVFPLTTNGLSSTSDALALVSGFGTASEDANKAFPNIQMPMYNLGLIYPSAITNQTTANITAEKEPTILQYPYLLCQSNILSGCSTQYMGGANGKTLMANTIASLQTNYSIGNYTYTSRSDLTFIVTKQTPLTQITTSICFPNGTLADSILGESTSLIYRIDFAERDDSGDVIMPDERENKK